MRFVHTNIIAADWRRLSKFYQTVFGCTPISPKRDLSGEWVEKLTGIPGAKIEGEHLQLPGFGGKAPTLEIFSYTNANRIDRRINNCGFSHIAFEVDDVKQYADLIVAEGGALIGEIVSTEITGMGVVTVVYAGDPEGNIIELQSWDA